MVHDRILSDIIQKVQDELKKLKQVLEEKDKSMRRQEQRLAEVGRRRRSPINLTFAV